MPPTSRKPVTILEATVTSKGQVTLPSELRKRLGLRKGSRLRFSIPANGPVEGEPVQFELEDLWRLAASRPRPEPAMTFEEMNVAKAQRNW